VLAGLILYIFSCFLNQNFCVKYIKALTLWCIICCGVICLALVLMACYVLLFLVVTTQLWSICLKMIGKGYYRKWVKSSSEQFITTQTRVGSTNGWIISQNAEISKFYFSTISGNLWNLWRHHRAVSLEMALDSSLIVFI